MVTSMHKLYIYYAPFRFVCPFLILIEHVFFYKKKMKFFYESRNEQCLDIYPVNTPVMTNEQEASMKMYTLYQTACLKGFGLYFNILYLFRNCMCKILFISLKFTRKKCMWKLILIFVILFSTTDISMKWIEHQQPTSMFTDMFYFLTMSNYQWLYRVSDKIQLSTFFIDCVKCFQFLKCLKINQNKQQ